MNKQLITALLFLFCVMPLALADNVTVHGTVGMLEAKLVTKTLEQVGTVEVWNTAMDMNVVVVPDGALVSKVYIYLDTAPAPPPIPQELLDELSAVEDALALYPGDATLLAEQEALLAELETYAANFGEWLYTKNFKKDLQSSVPFSIHLSELAGLQWGQWGEPWLQQRLVTVGVRVELKTTDAVPVTFDAWALNPNVPIDLQRTGWGDNALAMRYELQHPKHGQFTGVHGLTYLTPTHYGQTGFDTDGSFSFFPGEDISFWIGEAFMGTAPASQRISPLDIFPGQDLTDTEVINMARLLLGLNSNTGNGPIVIDEEDAALLGDDPIDFMNVDALGISLATVDEASAWLENNVGSQMFRRNVSKSPDYEVDKPKLDIIPVYVPAKTASGDLTSVVYKDEDGNVLETRYTVKPLIITYTEKQVPIIDNGIIRSGSDVISAVSTDDGATWKRFNVSHMANHSSFTLDTGERFPGDSRGPQQKIYGENILVVWTSAYARGGRPSFSIKAGDADGAFAVNDVWGVRGRQGSVNYNEDKDVGDQGIGEIPYYAVWACRGVLVWGDSENGNVASFPGRQPGDIVWYKPERLTSGRRDAFFVMSARSSAGFAVAWQEDPGGLLPGTLKGGGDGWSGATVHKKTDIWYSFIKLGDFAKIDPNFDPGEPDHDEFDSIDGPVSEEHPNQPEVSNRPKWMVPMSLAVRVSDNNTVNTENLKVQLDPVTGLPLPGYIPIDGALEEDFLATEHETEGGCDDGDSPDGEHGGSNGTGGGWGMARYAYLVPGLGLANVDLPSDVPVWDQDVEGDYRPNSGLRWTRFINKAGAVKTVLVTEDGRALDGDTGAGRPHINMQGSWVILGYEETKGLGFPPEGDHEEEDVERPEPDDSGKNVIYHSFKFDTPDMVSAGDILNLPALDDDGNLIPIYYRDAAGNPTSDFRQFKTENARRFRSIVQPPKNVKSSGTIMIALYKQGREGSGKPSDIMAIRGVKPSSGNPYGFSTLQRYETGARTSDPNVMKYQRRHMNMSAATVETMDPVETASDNEGNTWNKVGKWKQYQGNLSDESFANPYSDAKGHRGFLRGDDVVLGFSFTPNWGRLGGDHMDFYVRRSFDGGQSWTTDGSGATHTVIERDPETGEYSEVQYTYGPYDFEPGRNVSLLKGNSHTVVDPRLVPPMGEDSTVNPQYWDDDEDPDIYYVTFGTAKVLHGLGEPLGVTDTIKEDLFYTRTTDDGTTWLQVPWIVNPDSNSPIGGETVYRWPWLAHGDTHQGHAQIRTHPAGNRFYAIWHQWTDGDEAGSPNDMGNDIWFRRIDFMDVP